MQNFHFFQSFPTDLYYIVQSNKVKDKDKNDQIIN